MAPNGEGNGFFSMFSSKFLPFGNVNKQEGVQLNYSASYNDTVLYISSLFGVLVISSMITIILYLRNDQIRKRRENQEVADESAVEGELMEYEAPDNFHAVRGQHHGIRNRNNNRNRNRNNAGGNQRRFLNRLRGRGRLNLLEGDEEENDGGPGEELFQGNDLEVDFPPEDEENFPENEDDDLIVEGEINVEEDRNLTRAERRAKRRKEQKEEMRRRVGEQKEKYFQEKSINNEQNNAQSKYLDDDSESDSGLLSSEVIVQQGENESNEEYLLRLQARERKKEYKRWKDMFTFEESGTLHEIDTGENISNKDGNSFRYTRDESSLSSLITYIKSKKIVKIEELALKYHLSSIEMIQRLEVLQANNEINGIIDDRGKFISLEESELDAIANFINRKGRVSITELTKECNRLIQLI